MPGIYFRMLTLTDEDRYLAEDMNVHILANRAATKISSLILRVCLFREVMQSLNHALNTQHMLVNTTQMNNEANSIMD